MGGVVVAVAERKQHKQHVGWSGECVWSVWSTETTGGGGLVVFFFAVMTIELLFFVVVCGRCCVGTNFCFGFGCLCK